MDNLSILSLTDNSIKNLPEDFGDMQNVTKLYLSDNIIDSLNDGFCDLPRLTHLYIDYNRLEYIPESLCSMSTLYLLFANDNQLRSLPECISSTNLVSVRFRHNMLCSLSTNLTDWGLRVWAFQDQFCSTAVFDSRPRSDFQHEAYIKVVHGKTLQVIGEDNLLSNIHLFDLNGRELHIFNRHSMKNTWTIPSSTQNGVYIVRLKLFKGNNPARYSHQIFLH